MDTFHLQKDGKHYQVEAEDREAAIAKVQAHLGEQASATPEDDEAGFFERSGVSERWEDVKAAVARQSTPDPNMPGFTQQNVGETAVQIGGAAVGAVFDLVGEALATGASIGWDALPDWLTTPTQDVATKGAILLANTAAGQAGLEAASKGMAKWKQFEQDDPVTAANLSSVFNIATLAAPVARGSGGAAAKQVPGVDVGPPPAVPKLGDSLRASAQATEQARRDRLLDDLVRPHETLRERTENVGRITEVGRRVKQKTVERTPQQEASYEALSRIPGLSSSNTLQGNYTIMQNAVRNKARLLERSLRDDVYDADDFDRTFELGLAEDLATNSLLVGDAGKVAQRVVAHAETIIDGQPKTLSGLLRARKELDQWARNQRGPDILDPEKTTAQAVAVQSVRRQINEFIIDRKPNARIRESLDFQHNVLNAMDTLAPRAAREADNAILRAYQTAIKILPARDKAVALGAILFGVGGLGAAQMFMPFIKTAAIAGGLSWTGYRAVTSPKLRRGLGELADALETGIKAGSDPKVIQQLRLDRAAVLELLDSTESSDEAEDDYWDK